MSILDTYLILFSAARSHSSLANDVSSSNLEITISISYGRQYAYKRDRKQIDRHRHRQTHNPEDRQADR